MITHDEILNALVTASSAPSDAQTMVELQATHNISEKKLRKALRVIATEGRLLNHRVPRTNISGFVQYIPAYTIAPKPRKPK